MVPGRNREAAKLDEAISGVCRFIGRHHAKEGSRSARWNVARRKLGAHTVETASEAVTITEDLPAPFSKAKSKGLLHLGVWTLAGYGASLGIRSSSNIGLARLLGAADLRCDGCRKWSSNGN